MTFTSSMLKLNILYSEKEMSMKNTAKMTTAKKTFNTILEGASLCIVLLLASCEGFVNAKAVSKQIDDSIDYANAPFYSIYIKDESNRGQIKAPVGGEAYKRVSDTFTVNFAPDDDCEFLYWKIIDKNTQTEFTNGQYLSLASIKDSETSCTFKKAPPQGVCLTLVPVLIARPQVISWGPTIKPEGVNRDSRIQAMFDKSMDLDSIYFTDQEYEQLTDQHVTFLPTVNIGTQENPDDRYYGYQTDPNDPQTIVYKNIKVENYNSNNPEKNLLKYFGAPIFEDTAHKQLAISVLKNNTGEPLLPENTMLLVSIDKNVSFTQFPDSELEKTVTMAETKPWPYWVNGNTDASPPQYSKALIKDASGNNISTSSSSPSYINKEKIMQFRVEVTDFESCPAPYFYMVLKNTSTNAERNVQVLYEQVNGGYASSGSGDNYYECPVSDFPSTDNASYEVYLKFVDNAGKARSDSQKYYIKLDGSPIADDDIAGKTLAAVGNTGDTTGISLTYNCSVEDFNGGRLYYRPVVPKSSPLWEDWSNASYIDFDNTEFSPTITGLQYASTYEIKAEFYDKAKNVTSYIYKKNTMPEAFEQFQAQVDEKARCIIINTSNKPDGANKIRINYTYSKFRVDTNVGEYDNNAEKSFEINENNKYLVGPLAYASTYKNLKITAYDSEKINEDYYDNYNCNYSNENSIENNSITFKTKPQRIFRSIVTETNVRISTFGGVTGVIMEYQECDESGNPRSSKRSINVPRSTSSPNQDFEYSFDPKLENSYYKFSYVPYYNDTNITCDTLDIKTEIVCFSALPKVESVDVTARTSTTATLSWTKPQGNFSYYKLKWGLSGQTKDQEVILDTTATSYTLMGLKPNTQYAAAICCCSDTGESTSYTKTFSTNRVTGGNLKINKIKVDKGSGNNSLKIYITDYCGTVDSRIILKYGDAYNNLSNSIYINNPNDYTTLTSLQSDKTYYLQYYNNSGTAVSELFTVRLPKNINSIDYYLQSYDYVVSKRYDYAGYVYLQWNWNGKSPENIKSIFYKRATDSNNNWMRVGDISSSENSKVLTLSFGSSYNIVLTSSTSNPNSNNILGEMFVTIPSSSSLIDPVENLVCSEKTSHSVKLQWSQYLYCTSYSIYACKKIGVDNYNMAVYETPVLMVDGIIRTTTEVTVTGLMQDTYYRFFVVPYIANRDIVLPSDPVSIKTETYSGGMEKIKNLQITELTSENITLSWTNPSYMPYTRYKIYYKKRSENTWSTSYFPTDENAESKTISLRAFTKGIKYDLKITPDIYNPVSDASQIISFYTKPEPATFSDTVEKTSSTITVNWNYPTSAYSKILLKIRNINGWSYDVPVLLVNSSDESKPTSYTFENLEPYTSSYRILLYCYPDDNMTTAYCTVETKEIDKSQ